MQTAFTIIHLTCIVQILNYTAVGANHQGQQAFLDHNL